jgi:hypothetical protein
MASRKKGKRAKKKAQTKRKKERAKKEIRESKIKVNHDLPELPNMTPPHMNVVSDTTVKFDIDKAWEYGDLPIFQGERNVVTDHVQRLYDAMRRQSFNWRLIILSSAWHNGTRYKVNGQHTSAAFIELSGQEIAKLYPNINVREIIYDAKSEEDLVAIYSMYDVSLPRTDGHLTKLQLLNKTSVDGVNVSNIACLTSGMKFWLFEKKHERGRYGPAETTALVDKHQQAFRNVADFIQANPDNAKTIKRQGVIAAMFATYNKVPTIATGFWQKVADGIGLDSKTDPRYKLNRLLQEVVINAAGRSNQRTVSSEELYRMCVSAWNKWRNDEVAQVALRTTKRRVAPV